MTHLTLIEAVRRHDGTRVCRESRVGVNARLEDSSQSPAPVDIDD